MTADYGRAETATIGAIRGELRQARRALKNDQTRLARAHAETARTTLDAFLLSMGQPSVPPRHQHMQIVAERTVVDREVEDMVHLLGEESHWVMQTEVFSGLRKVAVVSYLDPEDTGKGSVRTVLGYDDIVAAYNKAVRDHRPQLCCAGIMTLQGLGFGCAADADLVLQIAVLNGLVYA